MAEAILDNKNLFKLRLVVARYGEMDCACWWNTQGILSDYGKIAISRGLPKTHYFAQARIAFSVAKQRCKEIFDPPGCITIWSLPPEIEDLFENEWQNWIDQREDWAPFFENIEKIGDKDLVALMKEFGLVTTSLLEKTLKFRRSSEGRAVQIPGFYEVDNDLITLLATGFIHSEKGKPAIPYARMS